MWCRLEGDFHPVSQKKEKKKCDMVVFLGCALLRMLHSPHLEGHIDTSHFKLCKVNLKE